MILVTGNSEQFTVIHQPHRLGKTEEELRKLGVLLESEPIPQEIEGKTAILKFDGTNLYYEYEDIVPTIDEEVVQLQQENKMLNLKVEALTNQNETLESVMQELIIMVIP